MGDFDPEDIRRLSIASVATASNPENPDRFFSCEPDTDTPGTMSQSRATSPPAPAPAAPELKKSLNLSNPAQMLTIDKLRELGIGSVVALPQLVVVGDQSSGKSSVLEAIMEFPLPRDSKLCTRFATNIVLRRSQATGVSVSIIPGPKTGNLTKLEFKRWGKERENIKDLDSQTFLNVLDEASKAMGIIGRNETRTAFNRTFSDDVLKVELSGPDYDNLSIIDIPGIFRAQTAGVTTKEDIDLVKGMVRSYIKDERTIILAVLAANVDIANQEILDMAKEADPKGLRTLGVLTKPDLVDKGGESDIIDLIAGKRNKLALGYSIVRNRGQDEVNLASATRARDDKEREFFTTSLWNNIDQDRVGIDSLKSRLQVLLAGMINREFPKLKLQIDTDLTEAQRSLGELGSDRETPEQQRRFLVEIAMRFQQVRNNTMDKKYERVTGDPKLRLPTLVATEFDHVVKDFRKHGKTVDFEDDEESDVEEEPEHGSVVEGSDNGLNLTEQNAEVRFLGMGYASAYKKWSSEEFRLAYYRGKQYYTPGRRSIKKLKACTICIDSRDPENWPELTNIKCTTYPELQDVTMTIQSRPPPVERDAKKWIEKEYRAARGYELDVMNANILPLLWRTQSSTWETITKKFMDKVIQLVHGYIHALLTNICGHGRVLDELRGFLMDEILERYKKALIQIHLIIKVERSGGLITKNHYFADTLAKIRNKRNEAEIRAHSKAMPNPDFQFGKLNSATSQFYVEVSKLIKPQTYNSNLKQAVDDLHSVLMVYHKVARKRVIDNITQTVDYFLLSGENSPLNILTPVYISGLSNKKLEQIAGEDMVNKDKRKNLKALIGQLQEGRRVIREL